MLGRKEHPGKTSCLARALQSKLRVRNRVKKGGKGAKMTPIMVEKEVKNTRKTRKTSEKQLGVKTK